MTCYLCGRPAEHERCEWCTWEGEEAARLLSDGWAWVDIVDYMNAKWAEEVHCG